MTAAHAQTAQAPASVAVPASVPESSGPASVPASPAGGRVGARHHAGRILVGAALMYAVLQGGLTLLLPSADLTAAALLASAAMFAVVFAIERVAYGRGIRQGLLALGFGRPRAGAMAAAAVIGAGLLAFFPVYSLATGTPLALKSDWLWVLAGAIALNGLAEETLFRGFVFGHLRQAGHQFLRAGLVSLAIFGGIHLVLFVGNPPVIALFATVLAVAGAFPFAFLFERAGATIWAGVLLHVVAHAFRLVDVPADQATPMASAWILVQFGALFLVFAFRNNLLRADPTAR